MTYQSPHGREVARVEHADADEFTVTHTGPSYAELSLAPGEARAIVVEWHFPDSLDNEATSDTVNYDLDIEIVSDGS